MNQNIDADKVIQKLRQELEEARWQVILLTTLLEQQAEASQAQEPNAE